MKILKHYRLTSGAHLLKHAMIFFCNAIIETEYVITNEELARFKKKSNSKYRQNMLPINSDDAKYSTR